MTISATTQGVKPGVCTSTNRPSAPFDGQVIYMTDVDQTAVWDGSQWTVLAPIAGGRNMIINGAMQVHQRGTSASGLAGTSGLFTADRYFCHFQSGTYTQSLESDGPTGSGLRKSTKLLCTTANASPAAGAYMMFEQRIEGQNAQALGWGTASAKYATLSFWVKSNVTGTYAFQMGESSGLIFTANYTISASGTWEKKTILIPPSTSGSVTNDNSQGLYLEWWLSSGSTYTSGPASTTWQAYAAGARNVGSNVNLSSAVNNYWQITGVQFEVGAVATSFEFEDYGTTLAKCQRYYETSYNGVAKGTSTAAGVVYASSSTDQYGSYILPSPLWLIPKRTTPSVTTYSQAGTINKWNYYRSGVSDQEINVNLSSGYNSPRSTLLYISTGVAFVSATGYGHFVADAEL